MNGEDSTTCRRINKKIQQSVADIEVSWRRNEGRGADETARMCVGACTRGRSCLKALGCGVEWTVVDTGTGMADPQRDRSHRTAAPGGHDGHGHDGPSVDKIHSRATTPMLRIGA